jgi:hypothetical protein
MVSAISGCDYGVVDLMDLAISKGRLLLHIAISFSWGTRDHSRLSSFRCTVESPSKWTSLGCVSEHHLDALATSLMRKHVHDAGQHFRVSNLSGLATTRLQKIPFKTTTHMILVAAEN